jgi:cyclopropane-fatty-acyl-phospholipid synthase
MALVKERLSHITKGRLVLELPNGVELQYGGGGAPKRIKINHHRFFTRLVTGGDIGFGEAWMARDWESDDLTGVLLLFIENMAVLKATGLTAGLAKRLQHLLKHALNRNTMAGSKRNIHAHYDLGNDFYGLFLDADTMMYSSALFRENDAAEALCKSATEPRKRQSPDELLAEAQRRKIHRMIELADIKPEHHVLDIGCGWGGFAIEAARRTGCRVTGITISEAQYRFAKARVAAEGLASRVEIVMSDYRAMQGSFDRIVSIEMLEAVGHAYYGAFFATCDRLLKPGGRVALQVICIPDQRYDAYRRNPDWIQKHIFPGGVLPSLTELSKAMKKHSRFIVERLDNIGSHYAETLRRWRASFEANRAQLTTMGFDDTFQRKWIYYLCYCEAGFQARITNNLHIVLTRPGVVIR